MSFSRRTSTPRRSLVTSERQVRRRRRSQATSHLSRQPGPAPDPCPQADLAARNCVSYAGRASQVPLKQWRCSSQIAEGTVASCTTSAPTRTDSLASDRRRSHVGTDPRTVSNARRRPRTGGVAIGRGPSPSWTAPLAASRVLLQVCTQLLKLVRACSRLGSTPLADPSCLPRTCLRGLANPSHLRRVRPASLPSPSDPSPECANWLVSVRPLPQIGAWDLTRVRHRPLVRAEGVELATEPVSARVMGDQSVRSSLQATTPKEQSLPRHGTTNRNTCRGPPR